MVKYLKIIFINIFILILLITLIEVSAGIGRLIIGKNYLFHLLKIKTSEFERDGNIECWQMKTDVVLSHIHDTRNKCFPLNGKTFVDEYVYYDVSDVKNKIILTLGGSTTSGFYFEQSNGQTYPKILAELAKEKYFILNGGVEGYSSLQELYKIIKDGPRIKNLDIIISLNGINELKDYQGPDYLKSNYYPFMTEIQNEMNSRQVWINQRTSIIYKFFPNISSFFKYYLLRKPSNFMDNNKNEIFQSIDPVSRWEINVRRMHSISKAINAKYYVFLQPTLGLIGPQSNPKKGSVDEKIYLTIKQNYLDKINELYKGLKEKCALLYYCIDISDKNPPIGDVYKDARHHNAKGNKILAQIVWDTIRSSEQ